MKNTLSKLKILSTVVAIFLMSTNSPALAGDCEDGTLCNPISVTTIQGLLEALVGVAIVFATPIIIFFIIYGGFLYVTARGNEQQIQKAHQAILYAIIGGLLILGAFGLIVIIEDLITAIAD